MAQKTGKVGLDKIAAVDSVNELLAYDGEAFIYACYRTFLRRFPDKGGLENYLSRLNSGVSKRQIMAEISLSPEGQKLKIRITGLDAIVEIHKIRDKTKGLVRMISADGRNFARARAGVIKVLNSYERISKPKKVEPASANLSVDVLLEKGDALSTSNVLVEVLELNPHPRKNPSLWFDLTTSLEWTAGVVGIIRAELEVATGLAKIDPDVRFCMLCGNGFVEIPRSELNWLFDSGNVADSYMSFFARRQANDGEVLKSKRVKVQAPDADQVYHPFIDGDTFLSLGWKDSQKEKVLPRVKIQVPGLFIGYLIYDTILLNKETKLFYPPESYTQFESYLKWVSHNCDFMLFGGENTKKDVARVQQERGWPTPPGAAVKFGTDIVKINLTTKEEDRVLTRLGIIGEFIITVGTIEPRKNHWTLHRAYQMAMKADFINLPQLVFCGRPHGAVGDLMDVIERNPDLDGRIIVVSPTDEELAVLYKRCRFTLLPSLYEGWSLTLPESLGQGKFCLTADTPPLREIADGIVDFAAPFDTRLWADKIISYSSDDKLLAQYEKKIAEKWHNTSWFECAQNIHQKVLNFVKNSTAKKPYPEIWFDLTASFLHVPGVISGIIRVELSYAKFLYELYPNVHYFAYADGEIFEIQHDKLQWLFEGEDIASQFKFFYEFWSSLESEGKGYRNIFSGSSVPPSIHPARMTSFPDNSLVFMVNIDWGLAMTEAAIRLANNSNGVLTAQFIHDVTPIIVPHLHQVPTVEMFKPFFELCSNKVDYLHYGGHTAELDGIAIQKKEGWRVPPSDFIRLASDFTNSGGQFNLDHDRHILGNMGVDSQNFIITVGTIEPRKNHEVLYKAYLKLLETYALHELPQLVFVGKPGWHSNDFISVLNADERVRGRIVIKTPNDHELDVLYRNCRYSLLPSFYEGYSLTLNETLSYGKFCLTSDTPPLREVGRDFVDYIDPLDVNAWADKINFYSNNAHALEKKVDYLRNNWQLISWKDSTRSLVETALMAQKKKYKHIT